MEPLPHVAVNGQVVWRVRENELGFLVVQQPPVIPILEGVAAEDAVLTQEPQVAWLGDTRIKLRIGDAVFRAILLGLRRVGIFKDNVDLGNLEARQFHFKIEIDQPLQFDGKQLPVPTGFLGELVVCEDVCALLCRREVRQPQRWHGSKSKQLGRFHPPMSGNDLSVIVDQDRTVEADGSGRCPYRE